MVIVGAGPAGATTARELAQRGVRVLMLDRADFPRDKPCGGGISIPCAALLPFDISSVIEQTITGLIVGDPRTGMRTHDAGRTLGYLTQRRQFDALLVQHAEDAGAEFRENRLVRHVSRQTDGTFRIAVTDAEHDREEIVDARVIVGADGANGVVANSLGFEAPAEMAVAIEGNLACPEGVPEWLQGQVAVTLGTVPGGYAWLFPKAEHINIGIGGRESAGPLLRQALAEYAGAFGWTVDQLDDVRGHRLPLQRRGMRVTQDGAVLVGDAAGLVDPLTGGGIAGAVRSGTAAAPAIYGYLSGTHDLAAYQRTMEREITPGLHRSSLIADIAFGWPGLSTRILSHPAGWTIAAGLMGASGPFAPALTATLTPPAWIGRRRWQADGSGDR